MAEPHHFESLDFSLWVEQRATDVKTVLGLIRPSWPRADVITQDITTGCSNTMIKCSYGEEDLVIRVFGKDVELFVDHREELIHARLLSGSGFAPNVVCSFNNGYIYKFVQGEVYKPNAPFGEQSARLVCMALVKFNSIDINAAQKNKALGEESDDIRLDRTPGIFNKLYQKWPHCANHLEDKVVEKRYRHILDRKNDIHKEILILQRHVDSLNVPVTFTHGDWRNANLIYDPTLDILTAVDIERSGFSYEQHDLAYYFAFGNIIDPGAKSFDWGPNEDQELLWVRTYMECKAELNGSNPKSVTDEAVKKWHAWTLNIFLVLLLDTFLYLWIQGTRSTQPSDIFQFADVIIQQYDKRKEEILAM